MAKIIWSAPALAQLEAIAATIALDKPLAAQAVVRRIWAQVENISKFPQIGRLIPEFRRVGYRQLWVRPCWIYYRITASSVVILHIRRAEKLLDLGDLDPAAEG